MGLFKRKRESGDDGAQTIAGLRQQALTLSPEEIGVGPGPGRPDVWGVLMETGYEAAAASLVAFSDGSTSMYFSNGGGVIGAGEHRSVRLASEDFLSSAQQHLSLFGPAADTSLPQPGRVHFYVRTFGGLLSAEASEDDLGYERHPLSRVFHAGHAVITAIRETTEQQGQG